MHASSKGRLDVAVLGGGVWVAELVQELARSDVLPSMTLRLKIDQQGEFKFNEPPPYLATSKGDGMAVDKAGRYYITSELGVQIFDPTGRPCGVLPRMAMTRPSGSTLTVADSVAPDLGRYSGLARNCGSSAVAT